MEIDWDPSQGISHITNTIHHQSDGFPKDRGNLFLSGAYPLARSQTLAKMGINCVVSVLDKVTFRSLKLQDKLQKQGISQHKWIDLEDYPGANILTHFEESYTYLQAMMNEGNVLVHCQMGVSRSATIVIAFLMKHYKMTAQDARKLAKQKRKMVHPNDGFVKQLHSYEEQLKSNASN